MTLKEFTEGMAILVKYSPEIAETPFQDADSDVIAITTSQAVRDGAMARVDRDRLLSLGFHYCVDDEWWLFYV